MLARPAGTGHARVVRPVGGVHHHARARQAAVDEPPQGLPPTQARHMAAALVVAVQAPQRRHGGGTGHAVDLQVLLAQADEPALEVADGRALVTEADRGGALGVTHGGAV